MASVSSSLSGDTDLRGAQEVDAAEAIRKAAKDVDLELGRLTASKQTGEFLTFKATKTTDVQRARAVALPTPQDGVRRAWEVTLLKSELDEHGNPTSFISFIDAESGKLWHRTNLVEHLGEGMGGPSTIVGASTVGPRNTRTTLAAPSGGQFSGATKAAADDPGRLRPRTQVRGERRQRHDHHRRGSDQAAGGR